MQLFTFFTLVGAAAAQSSMMNSMASSAMMSMPSSMASGMMSSMASGMSNSAMSMASSMASGMSNSMSMASSMASMASATMSATVPLISATAMPGMTQKISVGSPSGGLVFQPNVVFAPMGSKLEFHFYPKNHSVVQGPYNTPCQPSPNGIYSGFIPSNMGEAPSIFTVTINSTDPMWLYCSQEEHCQKGMDMVVNPPDASSGMTLDMYMAAAAMAKGDGSLGQVQGGMVSMNSMAAGMPTPTPTPKGGSGSGGSSGSSSAGSQGAAPVGEPNGLVAGAVVAILGWLL